MTSALAALAWCLVSVASENRLDVVTVRIEHKRSVIIWSPRPRRPIIGPACLECGSIEGIDLGDPRFADGRPEYPLAPT